MSEIAEPSKLFTDTHRREPVLINSVLIHWHNAKRSISLIIERLTGIFDARSNTFRKERAAPCLILTSILSHDRY